MTKYNLYNTLKKNKFKINPRKIMDYLSWCDGKNSYEMIKEKINVSSLVENNILRLLIKKKLITGGMLRSRWVDVGTPERLNSLNEL